MKPFDKLELNELIDLLAKYAFDYSEMKKGLVSDRKVKKYKYLVESLANEIERRQRSRIGPYNDISVDRARGQMKTA